MKRIEIPASSRILIVKLSAVGDVVHTLPALNALRQQYPQAHIGWAVQSGAANLLEGHPQLDELIILPRKLRPSLGTLGHVRDQLRSNGPWNIAIDFQGLTKSGAVAWLSGAQTRVGFAGKESRELNRLFMTHHVMTSSEQVIRKNIELLAPLGVAFDSPATACLHTTDDDRDRIATWAREQNVEGERFLVLDPFAGWQTKLWPREKWVEVANHANRDFGLRPLIFWGPGEEQNAAELAGAIAQQARALIAPPTSLREYIALLQAHARAVVAGDTGPLHLAAAAGVPVVGIFGPSCSRRNAPAFANAKYQLLQDWSQACAGTFARRCTHHAPGKCMDTITPGQVLESLALYSQPN